MEFFTQQITGKKKPYSYETYIITDEDYESAEVINQLNQ